MTNNELTYEEIDLDGSVHLLKVYDNGDFQTQDTVREIISVLLAVRREVKHTDNKLRYVDSLIKRLGD